MAEGLLADFELFEHRIHQIVHYAVNDGLSSISLMNEHHFKEAAYDYGGTRNTMTCDGCDWSLVMVLTFNFLSTQVTCLQMRQIALKNQYWIFFSSSDFSSTLNWWATETRHCSGEPVETESEVKIWYSVSSGDIYFNIMFKLKETYITECTYADTTEMPLLAMCKKLFSTIS